MGQKYIHLSDEAGEELDKLIEDYGDFIRDKPYLDVTVTLFSSMNERIKQLEKQL